MAEKKTEVIDLSGCRTFGPDELRKQLRDVRALIVDLLGYADDVNPVDLSNALYTLQYLIEDVDYKQ